MRLPLALALAAALAGTGCSPIPGWMLAQGRSAITDYRHFDNAPVARAAQPSPLPAAPAALHWPRGLDDAGLDAFMAQQGTVALLMVRRGTLVAERYYNGYDRDSIATSFSMAKSVVSTLVGIAQAEGRLSAEDPVTRWLPELDAADARFAHITLRDLLRMRSGIAFDEGYGSPFSDVARFYLTGDYRREIRGLRIAGAPNQAYAYSSGDTQLLAMALERAVGQPLARYLQDKLWQPMGAAYDASWSLDSAGSGIARGFCCLNARAVDFARLGEIMLHGGAWNGRQIVPADWVRESTAALAGLPGADAAAQRNLEWRGTPARGAFYSHQWRRPARLGDGGEPQPGPDFYALGQHGQVLYVVPETQTVVLRLGQRNGDVHWPTWLGEWARLNP